MRTRCFGCVGEGEYNLFLIQNFGKRKFIFWFCVWVIFGFAGFAGGFPGVIFGREILSEKNIGRNVY